MDRGPDALSGDAARDASIDRFLACCDVVEAVPEAVARRAAWLRTAAGRGSAADALVVALAEPGGAVLTGGRRDLEALALFAEGVMVERARGRATRRPGRRVDMRPRSAPRIDVDALGAASNRRRIGVGASGRRQGRESTMAITGDEARALIRRLETAMNERRLDELDDVVAPGFVRPCEATPDVDVRYFGKPNAGPRRRLGVVLATAETAGEALAKAKQVAAGVRLRDAVDHKEIGR